MKNFIKKSLILTVCLGLFLVVRPALAEGDTVVFDQAIDTGTYTIAGGQYSYQNDPNLIIPHAVDQEETTVWLTIPFMPTGNGTCDIIGKITTTALDEYITAPQEIVFVDGVKNYVEIEIVGVSDTSIINYYGYQIDNCIGLTGLDSYKSDPTDVYSDAGGATAFGGGSSALDLTLKVTFDLEEEPPPPLETVILQQLEHDEVNGQFNSFVMIDATHFILAYTGADSDGYIKTFSIDGGYNITEIASLEHDEINSVFISPLVKIDATHFILAYSGADSDGYIKTFSIDGGYNITEIASLEHDEVGNWDNSLVKIDDTHFILACDGSGDEDYIKTFSIDGGYNITEIASLQRELGTSSENSFVKIDDTHFILSYQGADNDGYIKTYSIDGGYNITEIASLEHDTNPTQANNNSFVKIDDTHFILAYSGGLVAGYSKGNIKTFLIDGGYNITEIASLEHNEVGATDNSLVKIDDTHFILAYTGADNDGYIKTFSIDGGYNITETDSLEHDEVKGEHNSFVMIDSTHFILAYSGADNDGYIKTFATVAPPVEYLTMNEAGVSMLVGGIAGSFYDQITSNLPPILGFLAGVVMLFFGIRYGKGALGV